MPHLWIENYGVLLALYANWKSLYKAAPCAEAANTWRRTADVIRTVECAVETQFFAANSSQTKGSVERKHGVQDRLVKTLRRKNINTYVAANARVLSWLRKHPFES